MPATQKIIPNLWFDDQSEEAAQFYTSLFPNSRVTTITRYTSEGFEIHGRPEGSVMTVDFELSGYRLTGINGGPIFRFTPSISLFVTCDTEAEVDTLWNALSEGGQALMALDAYPWSKKYGWVQDRYGLSWQLMFGDIEQVGQKIVPLLMYVGDQNGRAEEAMNRYTSIFLNSSIGGVARFEEGEGGSPGAIKHAQFTLHGEVFMAMDGGLAHNFTFNEAVSLLVNCETQDEIDYYWDKLSEGGDPAAQVCGWLKDKFGVSWQIATEELNTMLLDPDQEKVKRVTKAFMAMKKFDIAELRRVFAGQ